MDEPPNRPNHDASSGSGSNSPPQHPTQHSVSTSGELLVPSDQAPRSLTVRGQYGLNETDCYRYANEIPPYNTKLDGSNEEYMRAARPLDAGVGTEYSTASGLDVVYPSASAPPEGGWVQSSTGGLEWGEENNVRVDGAWGTVSNSVVEGWRRERWESQQQQQVGYIEPPSEFAIFHSSCSGSVDEEHGWELEGMEPAVVDLLQLEDWDEVIVCLRCKHCGRQWDRITTAGQLRSDEDDV